jgi:transcription elongation GreA/GreB family factor
MEAKLIHMQRIGKGLQKKQEELMILKNSKLNKVSRAIQELNACGL